MTKLIRTSKNEANVAIEQDAFAAYWDNQHASNYELGELPTETIQYLDQTLGKLSVGVALDNGCGAGRIKNYLEKKGWASYGTDLSVEAVKTAARHTPSNLICTPSHDLPFKDQFFDLIISWRVLHNIPIQARKQAFQEIGRVLKPGGTLICSVQSADDISTFERYKKHGTEPEDHPRSIVTHFETETDILPCLKHFYTQEEIVKEVTEDAKLDIISIGTITEKSGAQAVSHKDQTYWLVEAKKSNKPT
jgi:ubiquinone/menaquinone biosynthesis C-methylase UbiE